MFVQFRPWLACDRGCSFCYLKESDRTMSSKDKKASLMELGCMLHRAVDGCDTMGIIGGELFDDDSLYREWFCLAECIRNAKDVQRVFVGTHLIDNVDTLLDFITMVNNKEIQICTSYDTKGRFRNDKEYQQWLDNIKECQKEGYKVVVSATLTDAFVNDKDFVIPDGVDFKIQPFFYTEEWLEEISNRIETPQEYNAELRLNQTGLAKREDTLRWFAEHPLIAKDYSTYDDKHATILYDYVDKRYEKKDFLPTTAVAPCGHPYIAYCYADSDKCTMCDAREVYENVR